MKRIVSCCLQLRPCAGIVTHIPHASAQSDGDSSPIYGVKVPAGYRDWKMIAVDQPADSAARSTSCALNSATK